jgi:hypothetical protein
MEFRDDKTEPVSYQQAGLTTEQVERLNRRGLALYAVDKLPGQEDREAMMSLALVHESPAARLSADLPNHDQEEATRLYWSFVADAIREEDDDRFKSRWIQYF